MGEQHCRACKQQPRGVRGGTQEGEWGAGVRCCRCPRALPRSGRASPRHRAGSKQQHQARAAGSHRSLPRAAPTLGRITQSIKFRRKLLGKNYYFREQFMLVSSPLTPSSSAKPTISFPMERSAVTAVNHFCNASLSPNHCLKDQKKKKKVKGKTKHPFPPPYY